jgi:dienelactone hydrolase
MSPQTVRIERGGHPTLVADLYLPNDLSELVPAVVTGSGFGGVKEMLLPHFAQALASAGIATLAIDYAGFGASSGEPRQDLDPRAQIEDLRAGLDYLSNDLRIDGGRLGAFGPSMCGAHTLVLAGTDPRIRAAVSMVPFVQAPKRPPSAAIALALAVDLLRQVLRMPSVSVAVAGAPGSSAVMTSDGALEWIERVAADAPRFKNEITVRSLARLARYRPMAWLDKRGIRAPLRTILCKDDSITPAQLVRHELRRVEHDVVEFAGSHFELFGEHLHEVTRLTVEWFVEHLCSEAARAVIYNSKAVVEMSE